MQSRSKDTTGPDHEKLFVSFPASSSAALHSFVVPLFFVIGDLAPVRAPYTPGSEGFPRGLVATGVALPLPLALGGDPSVLDRFLLLLVKIGIGLTGFGVFFSFLGIIFFFDKGLIAMGNILFLSGLGLTIGPKSTLQFFAKPKNYKGTISFGAGFFLVLIGWPFFGMILEAYGFIVLFSGFWPTLVVFLQRIPIIGWIFQQPSLTVTGEKEFQCNLLFSHSDVETRRLLITTV
ncbi:hypothetical protein EJB05_22339, partial [Eragrostis curvula]